MASPAGLTCPAPRISWACDFCRTKRQRCLPSNKAGMCERCSAKGSRCTFAHRDEYKKKATTRKIEQKLPRGTDVAQSTNDVDCTASGPNPKHNGTAGGDIISSLFPAQEQVATNDNHTSLLLFHRDMIGSMFSVDTDSSASDAPLPVANSSAPCCSKSISSAVPSSIFGRLELVASLRRHHEAFDYFPFFPLPLDADLDSLCRERPFFLLGLLCSTNTHDSFLYHRLDTELRKVFDNKVVKEGERNLDLMQGALLYIARYPTELYPKSRHAFHYTRYVCEMFSERDLDAMLSSPDTGIDISRAYLACYYVASSIATTCPSPKYKALMPYSAYVEQSLSNLELHSTILDEPRIIGMVRVQILAERASSMSKSCQITGDVPQETREGIEDIEACLRNAKFWPQGSKNLPLAHHFAPALLYSSDAATISKRRKRIQTYGSGGDEFSENSLSSSSWRHDNLLKCLKAAKAFLDTLIAMPMTQFRNFTFLDWSQFIGIIIFMSNLCFPIASVPIWDDIAAREMTQFGLFHESLLYRMQELSNVEQISQGSKRLPLPPNIFCLFHSTLKIVKEKCHERVEQRESEPALEAAELITAPNLWSGNPFGCPMLDGTLQNSQYWNLLQDAQSFAWGYVDPADPSIGQDYP